MQNITFSAIICLIFLSGCNSTPESQPTNKQAIPLHGIAAPVTFDLVELPREQKIVAHIAGQIETIHKKPSYSKNATIIRLKNTAEFQKYVRKFELLKSNTETGLDNFPNELSAVKSKWLVFYNKLSLTNEPPSFPTLKYREENDFATKYGILSAYEAVVKAYLNMNNFFVTVPEAGFIDDWKVTNKQNVVKNQELATFYPSLIKIYYRIPDKANATTISNVKKEMIRINTHIQTIRQLDKTLEVTIRLQNKDAIKEIPLSLTDGKKGYRFVIPENQVKSGMVSYSTTASGELKTAEVVKMNAHYTLYLADSIIYLHP